MKNAVKNIFIYRNMCVMAQVSEACAYPKTPFTLKPLLFPKLGKSIC